MSGSIPPTSKDPIVRAAELKGYAERRVAEELTRARRTEAILGIAEVGIQGAVDILKEFIKVGISNPVVGAAGTVLLANILKKTKIIDPNAEALVDGMALAVVGVSLGGAVAGDVADIISTINPLDAFKNTQPPPSPMQPSAQVVVFGDSAGEKVARALAGRTLHELPGT